MSVLLISKLLGIVLFLMIRLFYVGLLSCLDIAILSKVIDYFRIVYDICMVAVMKYLGNNCT